MSVDVRCIGCAGKYVTSRESFESRTCRCPACGSHKAQLRELLHGAEAEAAFERELAESGLGTEGGTRLSDEQIEDLRVMAPEGHNLQKALDELLKRRAEDQGVQDGAAPP